MKMTMNEVDDNDEKAEENDEDFIVKDIWQIIWLLSWSSSSQLSFQAEKTFHSNYQILKHNRKRINKQTKTTLRILCTRFKSTVDKIIDEGGICYQIDRFVLYIISSCNHYKISLRDTASLLSRLLCSLADNPPMPNSITLKSQPDSALIQCLAPHPILPPHQNDNPLKFLPQICSKSR